MTSILSLGFDFEDDGLPPSKLSGIVVAAATEPETDQARASRLAHGIERSARQTMQAAEDAAAAALAHYNQTKTAQARAAWRAAENRASDARFHWATAESTLRRAAR